MARRTQLSPCIIAKAKHALGMPTTYSGNSKHCSDAYWNRVIDALLATGLVPTRDVERARRRRDLYTPH